MELLEALSKKERSVFKIKMMNEQKTGGKKGMSGGNPSKVFVKAYTRKKRFNTLLTSPINMTKKYKKGKGAAAVLIPILAGILGSAIPPLISSGISGIRNRRAQRKQMEQEAKEMRDRGALDTTSAFRGAGLATGGVKQGGINRYKRLQPRKKMGGRLVAPIMSGPLA